MLVHEQGEVVGTFTVHDVYDKMFRYEMLGRNGDVETLCVIKDHKRKFAIGCFVKKFLVEIRMLRPCML